jgi:hypothetical protein
MTDQELPASLETATHRFSHFLEQNGYPRQVLWVEQGDVVWDRCQVWVRPDSSQIAFDHARERYADGIRGGLGVCFHAFSELAGTTVATILVPKDHDEAQRALIPLGGLKLNAATNKLSARHVAARVTWLILSMRHRKSSRLFWTGHFGF